MAQKIVLVIAFNGYQQVEYGIPKKLLLAAGFDVITASNKSGAAVAKDGSSTVVDITIDAINPADYAGIFFIGGPGALESLDNNKSYELLRKAKLLHITLGAICISTRILAKSGILNGVKATGWNGDKELKDIFSQHGALYADTQMVVEDRGIITATGPESAEKFAKKIIDVIRNKQ